MLFLQATTYFAFGLPYVSNHSADWLRQGLKSNVKLDLCHCLRTEIIKATSPPQQHSKRGTFQGLSVGTAKLDIKGTSSSA